MLRMAGTDLVWQLDDSVDLASRAKEIVTARASNQSVTLMARLPGQSEFAYLTVAPGQLAWWSLGEESNPSAMDWGRSVHRSPPAESTRRSGRPAVRVAQTGGRETGIDGLVVTANLRRSRGRAAHRVMVPI